VLSFNLRHLEFQGQVNLFSFLPRPLVCFFVCLFFVCVGFGVFFWGGVAKIDELIIPKAWEYQVSSKEYVFASH